MSKITKKGPRWSWVRNHMGNPSLVKGTELKKHSIFTIEHPMPKSPKINDVDWRIAKGVRWTNVHLLSTVLAVAFLAMVAHAQPAATINIQADQPSAVVSSNLFGIFFEEINFAGEGGLYC